VVVFVIRLVYVESVVFCAAASAVHRSHVVSRLEAVGGIQRDVITVVCCYVGWGRGIFFWYVLNFNRRICV